MSAVLPERRPPLWWVLIRHEWRLTMRDFFLVASKRKKRAAPVVAKPVGKLRRILPLIFMLVLLHAAGAVTYVLPRRWQDTAATRFAVVAVLAFLLTWMLSYTMSRIVAAFHERRDLDLLLAAPVDPTLILAVRSLAIVGATTLTFGFFLYPIVDVGLVLGRWWLARVYLLIPLLAVLTTAVGLVVADGVVRLIGVRRARVGLQVFSALIGASMYFVSQARQFLPRETTTRMAEWFTRSTRVDDAPAPVAFAAAIGRGDGWAWLALVVVSLGSFAAATRWSRRRFVEIAQTPDSVTKVVQPGRTVIERRVAGGFGRGVFATLLIKEWRLILRAPQLISQVLLQLLYLMPLVFVAIRPGTVPSAWGPAAFTGGIVAVASTLATALAWLTVSAEDAPDLLAGSPCRRGLILASKLTAAALPPIAIVAVAAIGTAQRSPSSAAIVLVFGVLACTSASILAAAAPTGAKRSDFQHRHRGRGFSVIAEALQFLLWAAAAGSAGGGEWLASVALTLVAMVMPAIRLPQALRQFNARRLGALRAQPEALQLAGLGARQRVDELDLPRILVRRDFSLTKSCSATTSAWLGAWPCFSTTNALTICPRLVGHADDAAFGDGVVLQQNRLDLGPRDVVAGGHDHVVGARLVEEVAVGVHRERVAGQVPAVADVFASGARPRGSDSRSARAARGGRPRPGARGRIASSTIIASYPGTTLPIAPRRTSSPAAEM